MREYIPNKINAITLVEGSVTRQGSVFNALILLSKNPPDIVLIHDAARPWVTQTLIKETIKYAVKYGACIPVIELPDTPKIVGESGFIINHIERKKILGAQTPQGFVYQEILKAHKLAQREGKLNFTDDSEIYNRYVGPVYTVQGERTNKKITYPEDLVYPQTP